MNLDCFCCFVFFNEDFMLRVDISRKTGFSSQVNVYLTRAHSTACCNSLQ